MCKCKCGNEIVIDDRSLKNSNIKSCGCVDSLIGKIYGKLIVTQLYQDNKKRHLRVWECLCECGNTYFAREESLAKGNRTHCGCIKRKSKYEDLTNKKFHNLTVICKTNDYISPNGHSEIRWLCKCDCGNDKDVIVDSYDLKSGNVKSCGCYKKQLAKDRYIDLSGQIYGYLTVKKRDGYKLYAKSQKIIWLCDCICGRKDIPVVGEFLKNGTTTSCGCRQKETQFQKLYNIYDLTNSYGIGYTSSTNEMFYFDLEDLEKINSYTWNKSRDGYLMSSEGILFHRLVTNCDDNYDVDHIYHNKLDNRKSFLRITTTPQNCSNQKTNINNTSGYTGVYYNVELNKWTAKIGHNNQLIYLGLFDTKEDAINIRKEAEEKYFGEYSYDNSMKIGGKIK